MAQDIGLENIQLLANKIVQSEDRKFIKDAFPDWNLIGEIPYSEKLRLSDRNNLSVLDGLGDDLMERFNKILSILIK